MFPFSLITFTTGIHLCHEFFIWLDDFINFKKGLWRSEDWWPKSALFWTPHESLKLHEVDNKQKKHENALQYWGAVNIPPSHSNTLISWQHTYKIWQYTQYTLSTSRNLTEGWIQDTYCQTLHILMADVFRSYRDEWVYSSVDLTKENTRYILLNTSNLTTAIFKDYRDDLSVFLCLFSLPNDAETFLNCRFMILHLEIIVNNTRGF